MSFKDELKKELDNAAKDVNLSVSNIWELPFNEHNIQIKYSLYEEVLLVDGEEKAKKTRQSLWSHLMPTSKLQATFQDINGQIQKVTVKFSGFTKLHVHVKVGRQTIFKDKIKIEIIAPWEEKENLTQFIEQQVAQYGNIVDDRLPDEQYLYETELKIAEPGLIDLMENDELDPFQVKKLLKALYNQIKNPTVKTRRATYEIIISDRIRTYYPQLIIALKENGFAEERLYEEALWLLKHAAHREVVKVALILISHSKTNERDEDLFFTIAHHEEFTSYAILPLLRSQERLWQLANQLTGWGKVVLMNELIPLTKERKLWFLEQTWDDPAKEEAMAILCAEKAEIDLLLSEAEMNLQVFEQLTRLIQTLLTQSNDEYLIEYYDKGSIVLQNYILHARKIKNYELFPMIESFIAKVSSWDIDERSTIKETLSINHKVN